MTSLNTIKAILLINAKKAASKKGLGKTKGWTDEARAKAALTRKAKAKVAAKSGAKGLKVKETLDQKYLRGEALVQKQHSRLSDYRDKANQAHKNGKTDKALVMDRKAAKFQALVDRNSRRLHKMQEAIKYQPKEHDKKSISGQAYGTKKSFKPGDRVGMRELSSDEKGGKSWGHMGGKVVKTLPNGKVLISSPDLGGPPVSFHPKHVAYHGSAKASKAPATKKSKGASIGGGGTALKTRNELTKHFGLKKRWSGDSNPYSPTQQLSGTVKAAKSQALLKHLSDASNGWTAQHDTVMPGYKHFKKGDVSVTVHEKGEQYGKEKLHGVTIYGPKKKKPYTIPYYD